MRAPCPRRMADCVWWPWSTSSHILCTAAPPVLFGQEFKQNDTFQLWGLHAWVWENNPSGVFANWNPRVACEHATSVSTMVH